MPTIEQLAKVIASGDDSVLNRLVLKTDGHFELIPIETVEDDLNFHKMTFVTRWEAFDAGNDYVGMEASKDKDFLDSIMNWSIRAWKKYKETGNTNIINPYS